MMMSAAWAVDTAIIAAAEPRRRLLIFIIDLQSTAKTAERRGPAFTHG
jgi:hypothetical protein